MTTSTSRALQLSKKGGLVYDSKWYEDGRVYEIVTNCTSPPNLSPGLKNSGCQQTESSSRRVAAKNSSDISRLFVTHCQSSCDVTFTPRKQGPNTRTCLRETEMKDMQTTDISVRTALVEVSILECKQQWNQVVKKGVGKRQHEVEEYSSQLLEEAEKSSIMFTEQQDEKTRMLLQQMQYVQQENEEMRQQRLKHQQDRYKLHNKRMEAKLKTALQKKAEAEVEAENNRRVAERQAYLDSMMNVHKQINESAKKVCLQLESYKHKDFLPHDAEEIKKNVQHYAQQADHLVNDAKQKGASMDLVENMHKIIESLMVCQECTSKVIAEADRLVQEDMAKKAREASLARQQASVAATTKTPTSGQYLSSLGNNGSAVLQKAISAEALKEYESLQNKHQTVTESYQTLMKTTDSQLKKYRFDLQKAVNVPINAISNQSGAHLLDKLQRLKLLLSGQPVDVSGRKVSISQNTHGEGFVKDLLAKKMVKQSDEQVSSNHESAFPFAAVAVALWCDFPDIGELMLAHFYLKCPFLLPYHITKSQDQSNEEYYKSLGYNYESDGTIEKQDKYLRRMSGFMRLYAAIIITQTIQNTTQTHPHGIERAWKWLARLLNLEPQPDITATMLFDFLEVCGNTLAAVYGKQFFKLLQILQRSYFPKIEAVTPKGSGGPVTRLRTFLEVCIHTQRIAPPKGKLQSDFWRTT